METRFLKEALFSGMTSNAFKLGTALTLGWFWPRTTGCSILFRSAAMELIDSSQVLVVVDIDVKTISPPDYLPHNSNSTYFYVVRRANGFGYLEHTTAAAVKFSLDCNGELTKQQPNKIFDMHAVQVNSDKVQLLWYYCPVGQKSEPKYFRLYYDGGTGQIDYENPIATIDYRGRKFYGYLTDAFEAGRYRFAIRAEDADGVTNNTLASLRIQLDTTSPDAIEILQTKAI